MGIPDRATYLGDVLDVLRRHWPDNRAVNIVCHGHSVPAGYFATPLVDTFSAYPHLLHRLLKARFPFAVINVIVTAVGGENSESGAARFDAVLGHRPDVVTIDYGLNDRGIGLERAHAAWSSMIRRAAEEGARVILLTPTADLTQQPAYAGSDRGDLEAHAAQIRRLAADGGLGVVDSLAAFQQHARAADLTDLLSWSNHPNRRGHEVVAELLQAWFPAA